jgi:hypothetical protein
MKEQRQDGSRFGIQGKDTTPGIAADHETTGRRKQPAADDRAPLVLPEWLAGRYVDGLDATDHAPIVGGMPRP